MIKLQHQSSLKLPYAHVTETENSSTREVQSLGNKTNYSVVQVRLTCPYNCLICCSECKICTYMFVCNCPVNLVARFTSHAVEEHPKEGI